VGVLGDEVGLFGWEVVGYDEGVRGVTLRSVFGGYEDIEFGQER